MKGGVLGEAPTTLAADDEEASAAARSAPASLRHLWEAAAKRSLSLRE
jgi:hypothetical protein